jgi:hypothetical protein
MAKKTAPKRHVGFGRAPAGRRSMAAIRRTEQEQAEREFPELKKGLEEIKERLKENLVAGRTAYKRSLLEIYKLMWRSHLKNKFNARSATIAKLRGVALRDNGNKFSGIVAYCLPREGDNRRTISRWSCKLDEAFKQKIPPKLLLKYLD